MYQNYQQPFYNTGIMPNINVMSNAQSFSYAQNQIPGVIVNDFSQISANDVPMNATGAFFFKQNGGEVQHRFWEANGTIRTVSYKIVQPEEQLKETEEETQKINFDTLNDEIKILKKEVLERLDKIEKTAGKSNISTSKSKKIEVHADE